MPEENTQSFGGLENKLGGQMFNPVREKTFTDKSLAKDEIAKIEQIIKKFDLSKEDWSQLMYLLAGVESKLLNYDDDQQIILAKWFTYLKDFVDFQIILLSYKEMLEKKEKESKKEKDPSKHFELKPHSWRGMEKLIKIHGMETKFLIDAFFFVGRTSLSVGGVGFTSINTDKYEYNYTQQQPGVQAPQAKKWGVF